MLKGSQQPGKIIRIPKLSELPPREIVELKDLYVPEIGIHRDIPFDEYLKWDCFSKSAVSSLNQSPAHYWEYRSTPKNTPALKEGRLFDCMILEPELFYNQFSIPPDKYRALEKKTTKKEPKPPMKTFDWSAKKDFCKNWKAAQEATGKIVVKESAVNEVIECMKVINSKPNIAELLGGEKQVSLVWDDPETGVRCKARLDVLNDECLTDLKKTKDASCSDVGNAGFKKEIATYGYDVQDALYSDGWEVLTGYKKPFIFVAVEPFAPYECAAYALREESQIAGRIKYRKAQLIYRDIMEKERYEGYSGEVIDTDVPMYAMESIDTIKPEHMTLLAGLTIQSGGYESESQF